MAVISVKWFYMIVERKLAHKYEPDNLVNKVCLLSICISLVNMKNQDLKPWSTLSYTMIRYTMQSLEEFKWFISL